MLFSSTRQSDVTSLVLSHLLYDCKWTCVKFRLRVLHHRCFHWSIISPFLHINGLFQSLHNNLMVFRHFLLKPIHNEAKFSHCTSHPRHWHTCLHFTFWKSMTVSSNPPKVLFAANLFRVLEDVPFFTHTSTRCRPLTTLNACKGLPLDILERR
jgi:hypothetical protein